MPKKTPIPSGYTQVLEEIKKRVRAAHYEALKAVNRELIALYWDIGRIIVERQRGKSWGESHSGTAGCGFAPGIPRYEWFFSPKYLVHAQILSVLPEKPKTAANGCRNWRTSGP
jgi:hypothetical protein